MLIDRAKIFVRSGKGGHGCVSFRREKYVPKGGPDGGDGGRGGDVVLLTDSSVTTLLPLTPRPHYRATNGRPGEGKQKYGADGETRLVPVPVGTLVFDDETGDLIADLDEPDIRLVVARGGRGGFGNEHFKSATNQTPREFTEGEPWEERTLRLELKLLADVGLVGLPNAGKSTMLGALSRAEPRVGDYPFTTKSPHLGTVDLDQRRRLVFADLPGLIEGAADGAGLGHDFLRHIERTSLIVHVIDAAPIDGSDPREAYRVIRGELAAFSEALAAKPEVIVLNKVDLLGPEDEQLAALRTAFPDAIETSGATKQGLKALLEACWEGLGNTEHSGWGS